MAGISVGEIWSALRIDGAQAKKDAAKAGGEAGEAAGKTMGERLGDAVRKNATKALVGTGAALGAFAASSVQGFARFQNSMNEVFTLLPGISKDAMKEMSGQVKQFAKDFGVLPDDVVPALYNALSAGVPKDNVFKFLEVANKAAKGGVVDLNTAVNGLSTVVNAFGADVISAERASDVMFTTVRLGKTTMGELASSMSNVAPIASSLGIDFGDIGAALAAMTAQGTPTSVATTQLRAAFVELSKAGTPVDQLFRRLAGQSFREFIAAGGNVQGALQLLEKHAADSDKSISDLFGSVEAGSAVLQLTGKGTETFSANLGQMADAAGATDAAFETMESGIQATANKVTAWIRTMALDIGEEMQALGPIFIAFGPTVGRWLGAGLGAIGGLLAKGLIVAWGRLGGHRLLIAAITAAGVVAGKVYSAAESVASAFFAGIKGLWGRLLLAPGVKAAIAAAGAASGAIFAGGEAAGGFLGSFASKFKIGLPVVARGAVAALGVLSIPVALNFILKDRDAKSKDDYTGELGLPRLGQTDYEFDEAFKVRVEHWRRLAGADTEGWRLWQQSMFAAAGGGSVIDWAALGDTLTQGSQQMEGAFRQSGARSGAAVAQGVTDRTDDIKGAWFLVARESAAVMAESRREIVNGMRLAVVDMKEKIRTGKTAIIEQFRDLAWQSKHPFAEKNYAQWLREKHAEAMTEAEKKARNGRPGVAAQYRQLAADILKEYLTLPSVAVQITKDFLAALAPIRQHLTQGPLALIPLLPGNLQITGRAMGGRASGLTKVGERGTELFVADPPGYVLNHQDAMAVAAGGMGGSSTLEVIVRDPDGGLARSGIGVHDLADAISRAADTAHIGYRSPRGAF